MTVTFKKFVEFVDLETVSEEQIDEIFGVFSNNKKLDKLKAQRDELRAKLNDPKRNAAWDKAKGKADPKKDDEEDPKAIKKPVRTTSNTYPSAASAARHGEREWIASMKEAKESKVTTEPWLKEMKAAISLKLSTIDLGMDGVWVKPAQATKAIEQLTAAGFKKTGSTSNSVTVYAKSTRKRGLRFDFKDEDADGEGKIVVSSFDLDFD